MQIKIISTPDGEAPLWVREQWIGVELSVVPGESYFQRGVVTEKQISKAIDGYRVKAVIAINILSHKSKDAAKWWIENYLSKYMLSSEQQPDMILDTFLVFEKEVCKIV